MNVKFLQIIYDLFRSFSACFMNVHKKCKGSKDIIYKMDRSRRTPCYYMQKSFLHFWGLYSKSTAIKSVAAPDESVHVALQLMILVLSNFNFPNKNLPIVAI